MYYGVGIFSRIIKLLSPTPTNQGLALRGTFFQFWIKYSLWFAPQRLMEVEQGIISAERHDFLGRITSCEKRTVQAYIRKDSVCINCR